MSYFSFDKPHCKGSSLPPCLQREVKRLFANRFTGDHTPDWAHTEWKDGKPYPVQFSDDPDWLAHTYFQLTKKGNLSRASVDCYSSPTWPAGKGESK